MSWFDPVRLQSAPSVNTPPSLHQVRPRLGLGLLLAAAAAAACSGSSSPARPSPAAPPLGLRVPSSQTGGGAADALAASLLESSHAVLQRADRPAFRMGDGRLETAARFLAETHLEAAALAIGTGPRMEGSARIRRLAGEPSAPVDENGNGSNLDETLAADLAALAATAGGGSAPAGFLPALFPWSQGFADLLDAPAGTGRGDLSAYRAAPAPPSGRTMELEQVGHAMRARLLFAGRLLRDSRGALLGATPEAGMKGQLLLQQAVAMEETLLRSLSFDGTALGRIEDPRFYDPRTEPIRWLPRAVAMLEDPQIPGAPAAYVVRDQASSLDTLAAVLRAGSELAWLASDRHPHAALRGLLVDTGVFAPPESSGGPQPPEFTWEDDVRPALLLCIGCHAPPLPNRGFDMTSVTTMRTTGLSNTRLGFPNIVDGDHANSLLWLVLVDDFDPTFVSRMPLESTPLPQTQIDMVARWIDDGAPESAPPPTGGRVGLDLAQVMFRNLLALHLDPAIGALHDRHEGDQASGHATAGATGHALLAVADYARAAPEDVEAPAVLAQVAQYAVDVLTDATGHSRATVAIASGSGSGEPADLEAHARLTAGLLAAGRFTQNRAFTERGLALGQVLLDDFREEGPSGLFRTRLERQGKRYSPTTIAAVLEALRELAASGAPPRGSGGLLPIARPPADLTGPLYTRVHDDFLRALLPMLAFAEWDGNGEVLGDGIADTDGNGIAEPALAGGPHGRAPLLTGEILDGPAPAAESSADPVTWSRHILPLFREKCAQCHFDGARLGDYRMDTPLLLQQPGESAGTFPLVVPGDPDASLLYRKIADRQPPNGVQMPQALPPLNDRGKALVRRWIEEGATSR